MSSMEDLPRAAPEDVGMSSERLQRLQDTVRVRPSKHANIFPLVWEVRSSPPQSFPVDSEDVVRRG